MGELGRYDLCCKCGEYHWTSRACLPLWEVCDFDDLDDPHWTKVRAVSAQDAAEKWAERDDVDSADYSIVSGHEAKVVVRKPSSGERWAFQVTGRIEHVYSADKIEMPTEEER